MYMDGWGKVHSFKLNGSSVLSSGKFTETEIYKKNVAAGDIVPAITLAPVAPNDWSFREMLNGAITGFDNTNTHVWRFGPHNKEKAQYMAMTDIPMVTKFNVDTLAYEKTYQPKSLSVASSCHPIREPGTDNTINYQVTFNWLFQAKFEVLRYTTFDKAELITSFKPKKMSYIHSFSVTKNYAVFFFYPVNVDYVAMVTSGMHPLAAIRKLENEPTDIYVINLKTGKIEVQSETLPTFSAHHINAFETNDSKIQLDLCETGFDGMGSYMLLDKMRKAEPTTGTGTSKLKRFTIDLKSKITTVTSFPHKGGLPDWVNTFDFPTINEDYRGKSYCYAYGAVSIDYAQHALVKKGICDYKQDKVYMKEDHFFSEANFVPNPEGQNEDDGVLVTLGYDAKLDKSYLLILDAATFTPINFAYTPHRIPYSFHGNFFDEA